jgi:hypothetical protein
MKSVRKIIKVFIASPGDLGVERQIAREVADEYNSNNSDITGYQIEMVGWEETLGGIGRPQAIINKDLARCELFIGMLWKRWGTAPDNNGIYTSGFEEEFQLSFERYAKEKIPQMLMLFKDVDSSLLQDPGDALRKVLDFKENLIKGKKVLYEVFKDEREFEKKIRRWITSYVNGILEAERVEQISEGTEDSIKNDDTEFTIPNTQPVEQKHDVSKFLNEFSNTIHTEFLSTFTTSDIAYLKLLAFSLNKSGNDSDYLGAHDANLLYQNKSNYKFEFMVEVNMLKSGLNGYFNKNIPLWHWLSLEPNRLRFYMLVFEGAIKAKLIDAIAFVNYKNENIDHEVKVEWFGEHESDDVRISAIKYLSKLGFTSDIELLTKEYARKNNRTLIPSLEAIISIKFRESISRGFESILELQPTSLNKKIIQKFNEGAMSLEVSMLIKGLDCSNEDIRLSCLNALITRQELTKEKADLLLEHEDVKIRLRSLMHLSYINGVFYDTKAEKLLKLPSDANVKDKYYDEYVSYALKFEARDVLEKRLLSEFTISAKFLIALAVKDKKNYINKIRECLVDKCESLYDENVKIILPPGQSVSAFFTGGVKEMILNNMLSDCVNWLASCMHKEDMPLIRGVISAGNVVILMPIMDYFKRYGEWDDISLLNKAKFTNDRTFLDLYTDNESVYDSLAQVYMKIAKGREVGLIFSDIENSIKHRLIAKLPIRAFSDLNDAQILRLLGDGNPLVREKASLRVIELFSKARVENILYRIHTDGAYFYNVVYWLDFGISVKQSIFQPVVKKVLKDLD